MYDRQKAISYAEKYAFSPNPKYYFFDVIGGDCTNFVSQCLFAGGFEMVFSEYDGWFYVSANHRSASWTAVYYFRRFLLSGKFPPKGKIVSKEEVTEGDIVFLHDGERFYHTLLITKIKDGEIFTSSHSYPSFNRPLKTYPSEKEFVYIEQ